MEEKNVYQKIQIDGIEETIILKLDEEEYEQNNTKNLLEDTIELDKIIKEIKENE